MKEEMHYHLAIIIIIIIIIFRRYFYLLLLYLLLFAYYYLLIIIIFTAHVSLSQDSSFSLLVQHEIELITHVRKNTWSLP